MTPRRPARPDRIVPSWQPIRVTAVTAPDDSRRVLLQLPEGFVLLLPDDARTIAAMLTATSLECET